MNILIANVGLYRGGTPIQLYKSITKINEIGDQQYRFVIVNLKNNSTFDRNFETLNVKVYKHLMKFKGDCITLPRLLSVIRKEDTDLIYAIGCEGYLLPFAVLTATISKKPIIAQYTEMIHNLIPFYNKPFIPFLHRAITVSDAQKKELIKKGMKQEKIALIHNGIDLNEFDPAKIGRDKRYIGISKIDQSTPLIGIIANLATYKGHQQFLNAAKLVIKSKPQVRFLIIGDGPLKKELINLTIALGINAEVSFLGWRKDVKELMNLLDIVVLSSERDACPNVILEAMALKKPIISTKVGGVPEIVINGNSGFLVPVGDVNGMARAMVRLIEDKNLSHYMGNNARLRVGVHFQIETKVKKLITLFQQSVNEVKEK